MPNFKFKYLCFVLPLSVLSVFALSACQGNTEESGKVEAKVADAQATSELSADEQAVEHSVDTKDFLGRDVYLRGEMNDYGIQKPYRLRKFDENSYCTIAPLRADWSPYRFKFADSQWTDGTNFGYAIPPAVMREGSGKAELNSHSRFEELRYEPAQDGIYRFCIVFENSVPYASVTYLEDGKLTTMDELIKQEIETEFSTPQTQNLTELDTTEE